jgi:hypothetical protein
MSDRFVTVHRTYDPIQADLLGDLLRDAGVAARVTGTRSGGMIGVGQNILEISIAVPEAQAGEATDFLEAYFSADTGEHEEDPAADDESAPDERPLRPLFAAGSAFITFGLGHLYARRPWTAAALAAGQAVAIYFLFAGSEWDDWAVGATMLVGVIAADVVGGAFAARSYNAGVRRGIAVQASFGIAYAGAAMGLALAVGPNLADPNQGPGADTFKQRRQSGEGSLYEAVSEEPPILPLTNQHPANPRAR